MENMQLWYLDNGCSKHMTGDKSKFVNIILKQEGHMTYGDNNKGRILGRGSIGDKRILLIHDVLYVEGLKHNLLSISQVCDKGYQVIFKSNSWTKTQPAQFFCTKNSSTEWCSGEKEQIS